VLVFWWAHLRRYGSHMIRVAKKSLSPGARVAWMWDGRTVEGVIRKVFTHRLERTMNGSTVTRAADRRNPAYLIEQDGGLTLLMNHSQIRLVA
jgi:hypothetical protein